MAGYVEVGGGGGADGRIQSNSMLINRKLGLFAMTRRGFMTQLPLGFDISIAELVKQNQTKLPTAEVPDYYATAGRGDRFYFAPPTWGDGLLHLHVVDRKATDKLLADIAMDLKGEWPVTDGIAVTGDMVIVTTSSGRFLAFSP